MDVMVFVVHTMLVPVVLVPRAELETLIRLVRVVCVVRAQLVPVFVVIVTLVIAVVLRAVLMVVVLPLAVQQPAMLLVMLLVVVAQCVVITDLVHQELREAVVRAAAAAVPVRQPALVVRRLAVTVFMVCVVRVTVVRWFVLVGDDAELLQEPLQAGRSQSLAAVVVSGAVLSQQAADVVAADPIWSRRGLARHLHQRHSG